MSRVENMFGPRESWGKGDEMTAVRERAVRQEGGGQGRDTRPRVSGHRRSGVPTEKPVSGKKDVGGGLCAASDDRRNGVGDGSRLRRSPTSVSSADSFSLKGEALKGNGAKEAKKAGFRRGGAPWGGLAGFVSIRCGCGRVVNTCLHQRTPVFRCKDCGGETDLAHVSNIHMKCARCGFTGKYRTNRTEEKIQMECLNCSDIVYLTKIRRGNYVVEGEQAAGEGL